MLLCNLACSALGYFGLDFIAHAEGRCVSSCCCSMLDAKLILVNELATTRGVMASAGLMASG